MLAPSTVPNEAFRRGGGPMEPRWYGDVFYWYMFLKELNEGAL